MDTVGLSGSESKRGESGSAAEATEAAPGTPSPPEAVISEKYRRLVRQHILALPALFKSFTGLAPSIVWAPAGPGGWNDVERKPNSVCPRAIAERDNTDGHCQSCIKRHLALTVSGDHGGRRFTCLRGLMNVWLPIVIRGCIVALAVIQAMGPRFTGMPRHIVANQRQAQPSRALRGRKMGRQEFGNAADLLQLFFQNVETVALAELRRSDLVRAQRAVVEMQTVITRLRGELNGLVPAFSKASPVLEPEGRAHRTVHAALGYIHQHYSQPFTLKECANSLHLNASYLSAQFSEIVGLPFKSYVTKLRIERARDLLSEPLTTIAEVACAVGYASENRFRLAFKQATGLSPRLWRETLRMKPVKAS